jgi:hypothetical protein
LGAKDLETVRGGNSMALYILIRGYASSIPSLADVCFTKDNYGDGTNTTMSVNTPRGILGGSVAAVGGDYIAIPGTLTTTPIGLFMNDAAGAAFENAPAVASGKVAVMRGNASVEVDVYETQTAANHANALTYAVGDKLYSSANGLLTNEASTEGTVIAVVTKVPTTASPTLGVEMRI